MQNGEVRKPFTGSRIDNRNTEPPSAALFAISPYTCLQDTFFLSVCLSHQPLYPVPSCRIGHDFTAHGKQNAKRSLTGRASVSDIRVNNPDILPLQFFPAPEKFGYLLLFSQYLMLSQ